MILPRTFPQLTLRVASAAIAGVVAAVVLLSISVVNAAAADKAGGRPPNVLFIAADDLRNDLGCYGNRLVQTPTLDALAARSVLFERAYCQQAVCNPSRASLLTGRRPDTLGIWDLPTHFRHVAPDAVTLPQHFKRNGYFTQNVGKIFHNWRQPIHGDPKSWSAPAELHYAPHGDDHALLDGPAPPNLAESPKCECRDVPDEAYYDGRVAQKSVDALREMKARGEPFFLAVGFWKPHSPFNAPKRYWDLYRREDVPLAEHPEWPEGAPRIAWHNSRELLGDPAREISDDEAREMRHGYLANISYLDAQVGKVLDALDELQLADDTIVVFWSDHGYHLGEQTLWAKTSNFELDARVPLLIYDPRRPDAARRTTALVELLDLYPTLVELCGLPQPAGLEGESLAPVLAGAADSVQPAAYTQHPRPAYYKEQPDAMGYSVRTDTHRYTECAWPSGQVMARELYDHRSDPHETRNVVDQPEHAAAQATAAELLGRYANRRTGG